MRAPSQISASLETTQETRACKEAEQAGWSNIKLLKRGWPDRLFWRRRVFVFVEFKRPRGDLRVQQSYRARLLLDQGERVLMIDRWEKLLPELEKMT